MLEKVFLFLPFIHLPPISKLFGVYFEQGVFLVVFVVEIDLGTISFSKYLLISAKITAAKN